MKTIGYFEGTPAELLTRMNLLGVDVFPIGNVWDNYGKNVEIITKTDVDLIIGWTHKVLPVHGVTRTAKDLLWTAQTLNIPIILLAPSELYDNAKKAIGDAVAFASIVDPKQAEDKIKEILKL
ncbi:MAG: hypothetical protein ACFFCQ_06375 [Promethearchaeota archaeon]